MFGFVSRKIMKVFTLRQKMQLKVGSILSRLVIAYRLSPIMKAHVQSVGNLRLYLFVPSTSFAFPIQSSLVLLLIADWHSKIFSTQKKF